MSREEIAALPDKAWAPVIVATGAIEQHGPHLPVAVDAFMGEALLSLAIKRLAPGVSCYVAPPITIGKSNEHTGFPGTLAISKGTLRSLLLAIAAQIHLWGFRSLYILNTHGGNSAVLAYTLREIESKFGLKADLLRSEQAAEVSLQEQFFGYHANETETAWMLALLERYVRKELAVCDYAGRIENPGELRAERAAATYCWASQDLSASGIMGDAPAGTKEKGELWLPKVGQALADAIGKVCIR
jgi:creatinine amidohydrolase